MDDPDRAPLVSLVGAGPGDPELITVKGLTRLRQADVVIYDSLAPPELLDYAKTNARLIYAGKRPGENHMTQAEINALLIQYAQSGCRVIRLKGGDPFVFGRGGEEAGTLQAAGIPYEVIPGVSSAIAVPACAGIPVTHRNHASSFAVVAGCRKGGVDQDWEALAQIDTLVILMGLKNLPRLARRLIAAGRAAETPVAVIQWGTTPRQKTVTGTLATITNRSRDLTSPATIVIGEVVTLAAGYSHRFDNR
ncbi:MAG: uroporphyrinogen-III C-methyltransferase [Anaerolineales bacterium]